MKQFNAMAKLIRAARQFQNMTQAELAKELGYSSCQFVSNIERGCSTLPLDKFKKISPLLDLSLDALASAYLVDVKAQIRRHLNLK